MDIQVSESGLILPVLFKRKSQQGRENALPLSLLKTKLLIPPPPPKSISRQHLIDLLNQGAHNKLTLISAIAGSGKTTLLCEWALQSPWIISWVTLDSNDNDPITFWSHVIASLEMSCTGVGEDALSLIHTQQSIHIEAILTILINKLVDIPRELALVIDDYHVLDASDNPVALTIHQAVAFLLDHLPANMHIIITSRADPPLPLARLRAHRQLVEVRSKELFFTSDEIKAFLTQVMNLHITSQVLDVLEKRTEGWIAGLQLVALSLQKRDDISHFLSEFTSTHRYILEYLTDEVFNRQPTDIQSFLLQTSILNHLNAPVCNALTEEAHGQEMLERLERNNLFLLSLDNNQCWYRYHQIFRDFLRERLKIVHADQLPSLHRRASTWYEQNHFIFHAIDHALAIPDIPRAVRMITSIEDELMRHNEITVLQQWFKMLPPELLHTQPEFALLQAWICMVSGQFSLAERWLQDAEATLAVKDHDQPDGRQRTRGKLFALQAHDAAFRGDVPRTIELANQALANLSEDNLFLHGISMLNLGFAYWLSGNVHAASQALVESATLGEATANSYLQLIALCGLSHVQIVQGQRHLAFATSQRALHLALEKKMEVLSIASYAYVGMGHVLYEWNRLDEAESHLEVGVALSEQWDNGDMFIYGYTALAQVKQAKGEIVLAHEMLQRADFYAKTRPQLSWITTIMIAQQIRLALAQGDMVAVERWSRQAESTYVDAFELRTLARICIAKKQYAQALTILERQLHQVKAHQQVGSVIEISLLQAVAYQKQGDLRKALTHLKSALVLAEPQGYIRIFLDEGEAIATLLAELLATHRKKRATTLSFKTFSYASMLLAAFNPKGEEIAKEQSPYNTEKPSANAQLTKQERRIIALLTKGLSSQQIAGHMYISENTVKWYIKKIYSKLQVHNRTQLIMQIRDLDLHILEEE